MPFLSLSLLPAVAADPAETVPLPSNAFAIPRWGGVTIMNPAPCHPQTTLVTTSLQPISPLEARACPLTGDELHALAAAFVAQMRALLGLPVRQRFTSSAPRSSPVFARGKKSTSKIIQQEEITA